MLQLRTVSERFNKMDRSGQIWTDLDRFTAGWRLSRQERGRQVDRSTATRSGTIIRPQRPGCGQSCHSHSEKKVARLKPYCDILTHNSWPTMDQPNLNRPKPPHFSAPRLRQLRQIYQDHEEWLETPKWNPVTKKMQLPTMYDVVPMIIKPATAQTKGWIRKKKKKDHNKIQLKLHLHFTLDSHSYHKSTHFGRFPVSSEVPMLNFLHRKPWMSSCRTGGATSFRSSSEHWNTPRLSKSSWRILEWSYHQTAIIPMFDITDITNLMFGNWNDNWSVKMYESVVPSDHRQRL